MKANKYLLTEYRRLIMLYTTKILNKMLDDAFSFPYQTQISDDTFIYDSIKTEKDGSTKIEVVVPGYSKEDLRLEITDNILKLSSDLESKKFARQWKLTDSIDTKKVKADCKNGILTVLLMPRDNRDKTTNITIG